MKLSHKLVTSLSAIALIGVLGLGTNYAINQPNNIRIAQADQQPAQNNSAQPTQQEADAVVKPVLNQVNGTPTYNAEHGVYIISNGDTGSTNLTVPQGKAPYAKNASQDNLQRATYGEALLNKSTEATTDRPDQSNAPAPVGWKQIQSPVDGQYLYNRGHLLAYKMVGNIKGFDASESNGQNIITQTEWANQHGQKYYEDQIDQALDQNKTVYYQVRALYNGNDQVPRATWLQAKSADGSVNINVLVPNAEHGMNIHYQDGTAQQGPQQTNGDNGNTQQQGQNQQQPANQNKPVAQPAQNKPTPTLPATGHQSLIHQFVQSLKNLF